MEVAIGSVDVMFAMLKMVSVGGSAQNNSTSALALVRCQKEMWSHTWAAISDVCKYDFQAPELALHLSQSLQSIYATPEGAAELQKAHNLSTLCLSIITLARPRMEKSVETDIPKTGNSADQLMLMRSILEFIEALKFNDNQSKSLLSSAMIQLSRLFPTACSDKSANVQNVFGISLLLSSAVCLFNFLCCVV